jgi:hypothetical protein
MTPQTRRIIAQQITAAIIVLGFIALMALVGTIEASTH